MKQVLLSAIMFSSVLLLSGCDLETIKEAFQEGEKEKSVELEGKYLPPVLPVTLEARYLPPLPRQ